MSFKANALFACDAITLLERLPSAVATLAYLDPPWNARALFGQNTAKSIEPSDEQYVVYLSKVVQQLRRVLTYPGSLFIHWSPVSPLDVRLVMNQAFGAEPRYEIICRKKVPRNPASRRPRIDNEFILVYSKSDEPIYNTIFRPLSAEEISRYIQKDERGPYITAELTIPLDRPTARFAWRNHQPPPRRSWQFTLDRLETLAQENRIHFPPPPGLPRLKRYLDEHPGVDVGTTWDDISTHTSGHKLIRCVNQRPLALMERIVQLASNQGDLVLDLFFGSGTTLVAAQSLERHWWGADDSAEAHQITGQRLLETCGLRAGKDYSIYQRADVIERPVMHTTYMDVIASVKQIAQLQHNVSLLNDYLLSLKRLMDIREDDEEGRVENAVKQMEHWITISIANQIKPVESYVAVLCAWLPDWDRLDDASRIFLSQAEFLFDNIARTNGQDYSPFIIQYCRALENELLTKLFAPYTDNLYARLKDIPDFLATDLADDKTRKFAKSLQERKNNYTLGEMAFIMRLMKAGGKTLGRSALLRDFRGFVVQYFDEHILDEAYLGQISTINEDFRCKAAHPYVLNAKDAERCRDLLRACLKELILNYRGYEPSNAPMPK